jgi:hypothetical protein
MSLETSLYTQSQGLLFHRWEKYQLGEEERDDQLGFFNLGKLLAR